MAKISFLEEVYLWKMALTRNPEAQGYLVPAFIIPIFLRDILTEITLFGRYHRDIFDVKSNSHI